MAEIIDFTTKREKHVSMQDLEQKLEALVSEHRALDTEITHLTEEDRFTNQLTIKQLKKRKLALKDEIARMRALLLPDIIA